MVKNLEKSWESHDKKLQNLEEGIPNIPLYDYLKALDLLGLEYEIKITQKE